MLAVAPRMAMRATVNSEWVPSGQGALKEAGSVTVGEGSHTP